MAALLRRAAPTGLDTYRFDDVVVNRRAAEVTCSSAAIEAGLVQATTSK